VTSTGRVRRATAWVALAKVQSIRRVQGPVQRRLHLVDIHLDTAGRSVHAVLRDADEQDAAGIMAALPERCRLARAADGRPRRRRPPSRAGAAPPNPATGAPNPGTGAPSPTVPGG
jgi:putative membrane protein